MMVSWRRELAARGEQGIAHVARNFDGTVWTKLSLKMQGARTNPRTWDTTIDYRALLVWSTGCVGSLVRPGAGLACRREREREGGGGGEIPGRQ